MNALQVMVAVLAWFAMATALAVVLGRAVALAELKEGPESGPSLVRQSSR